MNITISSSIFAAAALFRGINDIRYYLNGLYLETGANGAQTGWLRHKRELTRIWGDIQSYSGRNNILIGGVDGKPTKIWLKICS